VFADGIDKQTLLDDAQRRFESVLSRTPTDADAALGLAQTLVQSAVRARLTHDTPRLTQLLSRVRQVLVPLADARTATVINACTALESSVGMSGAALREHMQRQRSMFTGQCIRVVFARM
jgi:hypothetical protein